MGFIVIGDSSLDFNKEMGKEYNFKLAPLKIDIGDNHYVDDGSIDIKKMLHEAKEYKGVAKSAAPSPYDFLKYCDEENDGIFVITLSAKISGTYNAAMTARDLYLEKNPNGKFHVIDSQGASVSETCIGVKLREYEKQGLDFNQTLEKIELYSKQVNTRFLLENLDTLIKNGRMSKLTGVFAQFLHIKPILGDDGSGEIGLCDKARSTKKAIKKLIDQILTTKRGEDGDVLIIGHCDNHEAANYIKEETQKANIFKKIYVVETGGLSSIYANEKGLVCGF